MSFESSGNPILTTGGFTGSVDTTFNGSSVSVGNKLLNLVLSSQMGSQNLR